MIQAKYLFSSTYEMKYPRIIISIRWKFDYIVFRKKNNESETGWRFGFSDWWLFECSQRKLFYLLLSHESDGIKNKSIHFILWGKKEADSLTMKINNLLKTLGLLLIQFKIIFVLSCVSCLTFTFSTLMF